jgi:hypothetical protein
MNRAPFGIVVFGLALLAFTPARADAQSNVQVSLFFEFGDDGWHAYRPVYDSAVRDRHRTRDVVFQTSRRSVRVPPGHMPPPGLCRAWFPGRPPGHQPRARPCEQLLRTHRHSGAIIIGLPAFFAGAFTADGRFRFEDERYFRRDDDRERFGNDRRAERFEDDRRFDDERGFRVVEDERGFRLASADDRPGNGRGRRGR